MAKSTIDLEIAVKAAVVRPGDTLVLVTSAGVADEQVARLKDRLAERLPGVKAAVIDQADQALVYKPGDHQPDVTLDKVSGSGATYATQGTRVRTPNESGRS